MVDSKDIYENKNKNLVNVGKKMEEEFYAFQENFRIIVNSSSNLKSQFDIPEDNR